MAERHDSGVSAKRTAEHGFQRSRIYLLEGDPGAGKTTLAPQFLMDGARRGEETLYVTLSGTEIRLLAQSAPR